MRSDVWGQRMSDTGWPRDRSDTDTCHTVTSLGRDPDHLEMIIIRRKWCHVMIKIMTYWIQFNVNIYWLKFHKNAITFLITKFDTFDKWLSIGLIRSYYKEKTGQRHFSKRITCQNYFSFLVKHGTTQMTLYLLFMLRWKNHKIWTERN